MQLMKKYPECCFTKKRDNGIVDIRFRRLKYPTSLHKDTQKKNLRKTSRKRSSRKRSSRKQSR